MGKEEKQRKNRAKIRRRRKEQKIGNGRGRPTGITDAIIREHNVTRKKNVQALSGNMEQAE